MRPQLQTLIFHGAPPAPASPQRTPEPSPPPLRADVFQDVQSEELLSDAELPDVEGEGADEDATFEDPETPLGGPGVARTDRPPSFVVLTPARRLRVIAAVAAALAALIGLAALVFHHEPPVAHAPPSAAPATTVAAPARAPGSCASNGPRRVLARRALVRGGVEGTAFDDRIAFAALTSTKSGAAIELDARTLAIKGSAKVVASDAILHVVPELDADAPLDVEVDTTALRTLTDAEGESAFGARGGFAVWGPRDGDGMVRLWKLPWPAVVEAPRVASLGTSGERVVVYRTAGAIWIGSFRGGQTTSEVERLSTTAYAGAPSLDARGDEAVVAWAERGPSDPWGIRWARWASGTKTETRALALPPGGPGDRAMAPSVAALGDGRFLLAWTEAGHGRNQVRAQVIDAQDHPSGEPIAVSAPDAVAGQETIALTDSGVGAIAYLVARRGSFELCASPIDYVPESR